MSTEEIVKELLPWLTHWKYSGCGVSLGNVYGLERTCGCGLKEKLLQLGLTSEFADKAHRQ